jgi:hypothetical protein
MAHCLHCQKEVERTPGKKEKKFCNSTCRSNYRHVKNKKDGRVVPDPKKNKNVYKPTLSEKNKGESQTVIDLENEFQQILKSKENGNKTAKR